VHGVESRPATSRACASPGPCGAWVVSANQPSLGEHGFRVGPSDHLLDFPHVSSLYAVAVTPASPSDYVALTCDITEEIRDGCMAPQNMSARLVPFPDQGTAVVCTRTNLSRGGWNNANFGPRDEDRPIERTWKTKVEVSFVWGRLGDLPRKPAEMPRALQPEESDFVEQALVADHEPTCGEPTVPASLLQTSAERATRREMSFSPGAAEPAVSSLARAAHRAPTTGRFDNAVALVSCAPNCLHTHTMARRPRQARAPGLRPRPALVHSAGSPRALAILDAEAARWRCSAEEAP
jgi:hypothetical protein